MKSPKVWSTYTCTHVCTNLDILVHISHEYVHINTRRLMLDLYQNGLVFKYDKLNEVEVLASGIPGSLP